MRRRRLQMRYPIDDVDRQIEAVDLVQDRQFQRRIDVAFFLVSAHVHIVVIGVAIRQLWISHG